MSGITGAVARPWEAADPLADARRRRADRARQVADVLRRQVLSGTFAGGRLPAESKLAGDFGVSRNAVRAALDLLRAEGLVERVPGVGTVVAEPKYPHSLDHLLGLAEVMRGHGDVTNEVRTTGIVSPPGPIAARLAVPEGTRVVYIERVRRLGGLPLSLDLTYLVPDIGIPLLDEDRTPTSAPTPARPSPSQARARARSRARLSRARVRVPGRYRSERER